MLRNRVVAYTDLANEVFRKKLVWSMSRMVKLRERLTRDMDTSLSLFSDHPLTPPRIQGVDIVGLGTPPPPLGYIKAVDTAFPLFIKRILEHAHQNHARR